MAEPIQTIQVAWMTPGESPSTQGLPPDFQIHKVADARSLKTVDLVVADAASFNTIKDLGIPILLLVDTSAEEAAILEWLAVEHEICRRDATKQELAFRMRRCATYGLRQNKSTKLDLLTGVANREGLEEYLATLRSTGNIEIPLCLISLELDRFKEINDRHGHRAGDHILVEAARLLQRASLGAGIVARLGGDEFALVVAGTLDRGRALAEFLLSQIEAHAFMADEGYSVSLTCSAGVVCGAASSPLEDFLRQAEECLFSAKQAGRNRVVTATDFDALAEAGGKDALVADLENRIRVTGERMTGELVLRARQLAGRFRNEADHDWLTGLFNRRHLDRVLGRALEKCRQKDRQLSIALIDLDHFGEVNTRHGHPTGDRALKVAAAAIQRSVRALDWVARYGGEEFCVVLPDTDLHAACQIAERIREAVRLESITSFSGQRFQISASLGIAQFTPLDKDSEVLVHRASEKVREAKRLGRNQVRF